MKKRKINPRGLRIIKTARGTEEINQGAEKGFWPLVKKVEPSDKIRSKYSIYQHKKTGEISSVTDVRVALRYDRNEDYELVIETTEYYPYNFKSPFAAYLIPKDLKVGDEVYLVDLIEDLVGLEWNQGVTSRLKGCEAKWNGEDFEILYDSSKKVYIMG